MSQTEPHQPALFDNLTAPGLDKGIAEAALRRLIETMPAERLLALVLFGIIELDDLARAFGWDEQTVRNKIATRELPAVKLGRRNKVLVESMRAWLKRKETKAAWQ